MKKNSAYHKLDSGAAGGDATFQHVPEAEALLNDSKQSEKSLDEDQAAHVEKLHNLNTTENVNAGYVLIHSMVICLGML